MAAIPSHIGKYRVDRLLGEGGMGTVYLAHDEGIDRYVAVKLLRADDELMRRRFKSEAQAVGRLKHANIVTVHDYSEFEGNPCIVMEFVEGESLFSLIRRGEPLPVQQRLLLIEQVCRGLAHAHRAGIVHRDIKPSNLMVEREGAVKIVDFGIARTTVRGPTPYTNVIGTPAYMAPEQIRGEIVDGRCDIFATGIVLYELLTGRDAFPGDTDYTVQNRIMTAPPEPFRHANALLTERVTPVIEKALAKDAKDRFETADHLADELAAIRKALDQATKTGSGTVFNPGHPVIDFPKFDDFPTVAPGPTPVTTRNVLHGDAKISATDVIEPRQTSLADRDPAPTPVMPTPPTPVWKRAGAWAAAAGLIAAAVAVVLWRSPNLLRPQSEQAVEAPNGNASTATPEGGDASGQPGQPGTPVDAGADGGPDAARRASGQLATAALLFEEGDFDGAETAYLAVLKQDPQSAAALGGLRSIEQALKSEPTTRETPLTEEAISRLIAAGLPSGRLRLLIASSGVDLGLPDPEAVALRLRKLGLPATALTALSPPATPVAGMTWTSPFDHRAMAYVAAGRLRMGSPPSEPGRDEDEIAHEVNVSNGFWMDVTEVDNDAYRRFILSRPEWQKGKVRPEMAGDDYLKTWDRTDYPPGTADAPVEFVSWHAARAYANWAGKRLPTELEWEHAARAGTTTRFWWGDQFEPQRVISGDRDPSTALRTNPWGLRDMTGSVWEWTLSLNLPYPYIATDARQNPAVPGARVIRGGSRANGEAMLRTANRNAENATTTTELLGFRCAR